MKLRNLVFLLLLILMACTPVQVIITETPQPTLAETTTVEIPVTPTHDFVTPTPSDPTPTQEVLDVCARITGYNTNGLAVHGADNGKDYYKAHFAARHPCSELIMDDIKFAIELLDIVDAREMLTQIILRLYSGWEGHECIARPPAQQVQNYKDRVTNLARELGRADSETLYQRFLFYGCSNEPSFGSSVALSQITEAECRFMELARAEGITVVSGNWGVGNFDPFAVDHGEYDAYLRCIDEYDHYMGVHEYTTGYLPWGTGLYSRDCLREPACVQESNWPKPGEIAAIRWQPAQVLEAQGVAETPFSQRLLGVSELASYYYSLNTAQALEPGTGYLPPYWHHARALWLVIRACELGLDLCEEDGWIIVTECCLDNLSDIDENTPMNVIRPIQWLKDEGYCYTEFTCDLRGIPSHCRLYTEFYWPGQSCAVSVYNQYVWWDNVMPAYYHSLNTFTWSDFLGGGVDWKAFNISGDVKVYDGFELHRLFEQYVPAA